MIVRTGKSAAANASSDEYSRQRSRAGSRRWLALAGLSVALIALAAGLLLWSTQAAAPAANPAPYPGADADLVVLDWINDIPPSVLDGFARQHNITVHRVIHQEPAQGAHMLEQAPAIDVAVIEYPYVRPLAEAGKLQPLDLRQMPNFRFVDPAFRNLVFDPANRYSVPYSWGAMGISALEGVFKGAEVSWGDLWDVDLSGGKIVLWSGYGRHLIAATLKWLGYSANSEDPAELAAARDALLRLRSRVIVFETSNYADYVGPALRGQIRATVADTAAYSTLRNLGLPVHYYYPSEGGLLWGDSLVIPANSRNPALAAQFIDYLLSPEVAAEVMAANRLRSTNEAAVEHLAPALRDDPILFPDLDTLRRAELVLPLSPEGQGRWDTLWAEFVDPSS